MTLTSAEREAERIIRAARKRERKEAKARRPPRVHPVADGRQRDPRRQEAAYLGWLHDGVPCIACLIEGPPITISDARHGDRAWNPIKAAHLKLAIASKGWREGGLGPRIHDDRCLPLCQHHHRIAPNACDFGQRAFVDRLGLGDGVADLCRDLHQAFLSGAPGEEVIRRYLKGKS